MTSAGSPLVLPIRHHSPASALQVRRAIAERRPRLVLIEGPADATPLIPLLADPGTAPPVALYAYRAGAESRALFYPFCAYSPEYVAVVDGLASGAIVQFCDVPARTTLDWPLDHAANAAGTTETASGYASFTTALADAVGASSFEELWEAAFEQEQRLPDAFVEVMADFGSKAKAVGAGERDERDALRERVMAGAIRLARASGIAPNEIVLVCGAAHASAVAAYVATGAAPPELPAGVPAEIALIPYSYPRLSEQSGYGAGNRAPWFYQQVWEHGNDYEVATRRTLVALAARLRARGHVASVAQCVDGYTLALTLARMRDKRGPGVDELRDAAVACFGQGQPAVVQAALGEVLVGDAIGRVTHRVGRTPLQSEFYATANRLRLPVVDSPRELLIHMPVPTEAEQSIFLHRLVVATVPFAREIESGLGGGSRPVADDPLEQLAQVREKWELQWSPLTDAALVEQSARGNTLTEVSGRMLRDRLRRAAHVDAATGVLLRLALCDLADSFPAALAYCESLAVDSASFPALGRAAYHLDGLLNYGAARQLPVNALTSLAQRLFARAILYLPAAVICGDEAASEIEQTAISLHELVRRASPIIGDTDAFWDAVERAVAVPTCHPSLRGLGLALLDLAGRLPAGTLASQLRYWLSRAADAGDNARLVAGLFALHRGTLIRNRSLIGAVTEFLSALAIDDLIPLLPVLRRTLGDLSAAERAYLTETLTAVLGLEPAEAVNYVSAEEIARARAADAAVAATLASWEKRYGIA